VETPGIQAWLRRSPRPVLRWPRSAYGAIVAWMLALRRREGPRELLVADPAADEARAADIAPAAPPRPAGLIEIVLPSGVVVRVDAQVDEAALRCVLGVLERGLSVRSAA